MLSISPSYNFLLPSLSNCEHKIIEKNSLYFRVSTIRRGDKSNKSNQENRFNHSRVINGVTNLTFVVSVIAKFNENSHADCPVRPPFKSLDNAIANAILLHDSVVSRMSEMKKFCLYLRAHL